MNEIRFKGLENSSQPKQMIQAPLMWMAILPIYFYKSKQLYFICRRYILGILRKEIFMPRGRGPHGPKKLRRRRRKNEKLFG